MFKYQLQLEDGTPAGDYSAVSPGFQFGTRTMPLWAGRSLRVVEVRQEVLVVAPG